MWCYIVKRNTFNDLRYESVFRNLCYHNKITPTEQGLEKIIKIKNEFNVCVYGDEYRKYCVEIISYIVFTMLLGMVSKTDNSFRMNYTILNNGIHPDGSDKLYSIEKITSKKYKITINENNKDIVCYCKLVKR